MKSLHDRESGLPESRLVEALIKWLRAQPGCYARKAHGSAYASGWPDIVGCLNGRAFVLEVKRPGEPHPLTANQRAALVLWQRAGAIVGVVHSIEETAALLSGAEVS